MARTFDLIDSESVLSTISLILSTGIIAKAGGFGNTDLEGEQIDFSAPVGIDRVLDDYQMNLYGSSHDNAAAQIQALIKMLQKAAEYWKTPWQSYPIYLKQQTTAETNPRYSIVHEPRKLSYSDLFDVPFDFDSRMEAVKLSLLREHPWRETIPGTLPSAITLTKTDGSVDKDQCFIVNEQHTQTPSHVYCYDASAGSPWSANLISSTSIPMWSVAGSTPAVNDIVYIGWNTRPGHAVVVPIATAGVYTADVRAQAYISGAWVDLVFGDVAGKFMGTYPPQWVGSSPSQLFTTTGEHLFAFCPDIWQTVAINGVTAYWIRFLLNAVTSWTTTPVTHGTETIYGPKKPYFEISNTRIGGDAPPRFRMEFSIPYGGHNSSIVIPNAAALSRVIVGAKGTNKWLTSLNDFTSRFNLHQYGLPASWARTLGTDTTEVVDTTSPEGYELVCSFATDALMTARVTLTGTGMWPKYKGSYRIFIAGYHSAGAVGDVEVKLRIQQGGISGANPTYDTDPVPNKCIAPAQAWELFDCGWVNIPFNPIVSADSLEGNLIFTIMAQRIAGTGSLHMQQLIIIPVDEWYTQIDDSQKDTNGSSSLRSTVNQSYARITTDFDILSNRSQREGVFTTNWVPTDVWHRTSSLSRLKPAKQYRFYTLVMGYNTAFGTGPFTISAGSALLVQMRKVNSFLALRGNG